MKRILFFAAGIFAISAMMSCGGTGKTGDSAQNAAVEHVSTDQFKKLIEQHAGTLVDVRTPAEYNAERIPGVEMNVDFKAGDFKDKLAKLDKNKTYLIYCRSGHRSGLASSIMESMGFKKVYDLKGGIKGWKAKSYPTEGQNVVAPSVEHVSTDEFKNLIEKNAGVLVDVRTPAEYKNEHIPGAEMNVDFKASDFKDQLAKLDKNKTYLIYCRSGHRSGLASKIMEEMGFKKVYDLKGGINGWKEKGYETVK